MPSRSRNLKTALAITAGALFLSAEYAQAQNRLGSGRGQQRNTARYPRGQPPASRDINTELRYRNAVVTGNVPGSSFRGDIGYRSPLEFRGATGSDDLFAFRRDSLYSGLGGTGIRGTDALQYQFGLSTGMRPSGVLTGSLVVDRGFRGASPTDLRPDDPGDIIRRRLPDDPRLDGRGTNLNRGARVDALRSTSTYLANRSLSTELLGRRPLDTGDALEITAGSLSGVRFDVRREEALRSVFEEDQKPRNETSLSANTGRIETRTVYDDIRSQLDASLPTVPRTGAADTDPDTEPDTALRARTSATEERLDRLRSLLREEAVEPEGDDTQPGPDATTDFDEEMIEAIRSGKSIDDFVRGEAALGRDIYAEHMKTGADMLAEGSYFDAEGRFTAALGIKPADPIAQTGRIHAQAGAGMLASAAVNLRHLLTEHPELAGVRYGEDLLPNRDRLRQLSAVVDQRIEQSPLGHADLLLLKAYIGYQLGSSEVIIDAFSRIASIRDNAEAPPDPVVEFVRKIWVEDPGQ